MNWKRCVPFAFSNSLNKIKLQFVGALWCNNAIVGKPIYIEETKQNRIHPISLNINNLDINKWAIGSIIAPFSWSVLDIHFIRRTVSWKYLFLYINSKRV